MLSYDSLYLVYRHDLGCFYCIINVAFMTDVMDYMDVTDVMDYMELMT